jgi:hypothetical protein
LSFGGKVWKGEEKKGKVKEKLEKTKIRGS